MAINCQAAKDMANVIRAACPWLDLYIPAEHEDFVGITYHEKYLTEGQILEIDCKIIDKCDLGTVIYIPEGDELQGGRLIEHDHAINNCLPVCLFDTAKQAIEHLTELYEYNKGGSGMKYGGNSDE
jgi:hypothetical protein